MDLKVGDIVQLKSGSPAMTVNSYDKAYSRVEVVWFFGSELCRSVVSEDVLVREGQGD